MSARTAWTWVKLARAGAAALFIVLAVVLAVHFAARRPGPVAGPHEIADQKIDNKEGVEHRDYKDGRLLDDVRADRSYLGADGLNHLEGGVVIRDYSAGVETEIRADNVTYDPGLAHFTMSGKVAVKTKDIRFESPTIVFDKTPRQFRTETGGTFTADRLSGTARTIIYDDEAAALRLAGGFRLEAKASDPAATAVVISGDSLSYDRGRKSGEAAGRVRVSRAGMDASAGRLDFGVADDESAFRSMVFSNGVSCAFGSPAERTLDRQKLQAERVQVVPSPDLSGISAVEAHGSCLLALTLLERPPLSTKADSINLTFGKETQLVNLEANGRARVDIDAAGTGGRSLEADDISYDNRTRLVKAVPMQGGKARMSTAGSRIEAATISLGLAGDAVDAEGSVTCVLVRRPEEPAIGFFAKGKPVFITCGRLASAGEPAKSFFSGKVRAWQDRRVVEAGELEVAGDTGNVLARGGVDAILPFGRDATSQESVAEAGGERMCFTSKDGTAAFEGTSFARAGKADLTAGSVLLRLTEDGSRLAELRARLDVVVKQGRYEGFGSEASYDPAAEIIVLTGRPRLEEKGKGASRGDKLTFSLSDGRILIENSGQGRSVTIVNRGQ